MSDCLGSQGAQETTSNVEATQGTSAQHGAAHCGRNMTTMPNVCAIMDAHKAASRKSCRNVSNGTLRPTPALAAAAQESWELTGCLIQLALLYLASHHSSSVIQRSWLLWFVKAKGHASRGVPATKCSTVRSMSSKSINPTAACRSSGVHDARLPEPTDITSAKDHLPDTDVQQPGARWKPRCQKSTANAARTAPRSA
eukprot:CAMPEP_0115513408 /NCGR_PEP_ID=MMETSP0271-20121206/75065_1 /TAXON_ID=71861 /ORGANISM="Scrippsiella trochoidea, Strain CCMP3099" /LENGTH=197 /DNA_ID=CAMNT_0002943707 /DNA_START=395 /DNA_END=985 /DNA_ORIENTATION=+